jgi:hypothetical protein
MSIEFHLIIGFNKSQQLTFRLVAQGFKHIRGLAGRPFSLLQHVKDKTQLAQQTLVIQTSSRGVLKGQISQQRGIVHDLQ